MMNKKKVVSKVLMFFMVMLLVATPTLAATSVQKNVTYVSGTTRSAINSMTGFNLYTPSGVSYSLGIKKAVCTVKNTGNCAIHVYEITPGGACYDLGYVNAGSSRAWNVSGSNKRVTLRITATSRSGSRALVSMSPGSVS